MTTTHGSSTSRTLPAVSGPAAAASGQAHQDGTPWTLGRRAALGALGSAVLASLAACASRDGGTGAAAGSGQAASPGATGTTSSADPADDAIAQGVADQVAAHWPHMSAVWPGLDYTRHDIILFKVDNQLAAQRAWLVNAQEHREMKPEEYASITVPPSYDKVDHNGRPSITLVMNPSLGGQGTQGLGSDAEAGATGEQDQEGASGGSQASTADSEASGAADPQEQIRSLYRLATHELVHFYYQAEAIRSAESSRDTAYPLDAEPRLLRAMVHHRLNQAVTEPDSRQDHLGRARYWYDRWTSEHAQEAGEIREYDIREGTAVYIERCADYVADPPLEGERLHQAQKAGLDTGYYSSVDQESYVLGFVSGVLLDEASPGWKDSFYASGKAPAELLLSQVEAVKDEEDATVRSEIDKLVSQENERVKKDMDAVDQAEADTSTAYLRYEGSPQVAYEGSYTYKDRTVLVNTLLDLRSGDGGSISVLAHTVFRTKETPENTYNIPLAAGTYTYQDGRLKVTGEAVSGETAATRTTEGGREIFTMKVE